MKGQDRTQVRLEVLLERRIPIYDLVRQSHPARLKTIEIIYCMQAQIPDEAPSCSTAASPYLIPDMIAPTLVRGRV